MYQALPLSCLDCHPICRTCMNSDVYRPSLTTNESCLTCPNSRYYSALTNYYGTCLCLKGLG